MDASSLSLLAIGFLLGLLLALLWYGLYGRMHQRRLLQAELTERKDEFVGLASHYLLTPISIIQTALASLREQHGTLEPEERERLYDAIERGQQRLWILAEQMVAVSQIDGGSLKLASDVVDLAEIITSAMLAIDPFARLKRIRLQFKDLSEASRQVHCDARRMKQALIAVLDNAVKFSQEEGTVQVELTLQDELFTVTVQDQGIGMPAGVIDHLAERFYRGTRLYVFDYEGLGLGLYVAQAIIRAHQGNISFESQLKRGTLVRIQFPRL